MVVGGPGPGNAGLVAGGDGGDVALAARRELRLRLALLAILAGQAVAFLVPRGGPVALWRPGWAPSRSWSSSSMILPDLRRAELPAGRPADDPGRAGRRGAGAHGRPGRGHPAARGVMDRSPRGSARSPLEGRGPADAVIGEPQRGHARRVDTRCGRRRRPAAASAGA